LFVRIFLSEFFVGNFLKEVSQTVDQSNSSRQFAESFDKTFSKVFAVEGAEPSSPSAEGEILTRRLFLQAFSLRLFQAEKKRIFKFVHCDI